MRIGRGGTGEVMCTPLHASGRLLTSCRGPHAPAYTTLDCKDETLVDVQESEKMCSKQTHVW